MNKIVETKEGILLQFYIKPNSKEDRIIIEEDALLLHIKATPVKGKANKAIIQFLARLFDIPKNMVTIVSGMKSKTKTVLFRNLTNEQKKNLNDWMKEKFYNTQ